MALEKIVINIKHIVINTKWTITVTSSWSNIKSK